MASVEKRVRDGQVTWLARWRDPEGAQRKKTFGKKADADRFLTGIDHSILSGGYIDPAAGRQTFADFYAEWASRQVWESTTDKAMDLAARSATFRDLPLSKLRRSHVEAWIKAMDAADLAPGTIRTRLNNVRSVLRAAVRDRVISTDPAAGVTLPRDRRREAKMVLPTPVQVRAVLDAADEPFRAYVALAAFAGLRLGEAAAIQVGDIDFLGRRLHVRRQVQRAGAGQVEVRAPKYGSERTVYLADGLVELLARHVERFCAGTDPARWLFLGQGDAPPHQNTVGHRWRKACQAAGVQGVTLHDLRHYFASGLIAAGCDVVTVQRAMGHAKATTTLNTHSHLWRTAEDRTRRAAEAMLAEVVDGGGSEAACAPGVPRGRAG